MKTEKNIIEKADARIVKTVRKLRSVNENNEIDNNEQKKNNTPIEKRVPSNSTSDKTNSSLSNNNINNVSALYKRGSKSNILTPIINKGNNDINQRISIDGSLRIEEKKMFLVMKL